jgi:hypothetical protein
LFSLVFPFDWSDPTQYLSTPIHFFGTVWMAICFVLVQRRTALYKTVGDSFSGKLGAFYRGWFPGQNDVFGCRDKSSQLLRS